MPRLVCVVAGIAIVLGAGSASAQGRGGGGGAGESSSRSAIQTPRLTGEVVVRGILRAGRTLVPDDTLRTGEFDVVAEIYLGPTLTARLRSRFLAEHGSSG